MGNLMAADIRNRVDLLIEEEPLGGDGAPAAAPGNNAIPNGTNRFGAVRDRLFHAMLVKMSLSYSRHVSHSIRRVIEFFVLLAALISLSLLVYIHIVFSRNPGTCLEEIRDSWPKKGILRVEVITHLAELQAQQEAANELRFRIQGSTYFSPKDVFLYGPNALPEPLKSRTPRQLALKNRTEIFDQQAEQRVRWLLGHSLLVHANSIVNFFFQPIGDSRRLPAKRTAEDGEEPGSDDDDDEHYDEEYEDEPAFVYAIEYSLHYGLLKLSQTMRQEFGIPAMLVRIDADDKCFGDYKNRFIMRYFIGYEDIVISSVRALADNETEKGYLRDLMTGEHYHFVTVGVTRASYLTALLVMLIFTFAISMLLRFSHHQIFLFIVDLLQMFELNQPLVFPIAPLLTVILALVGMEAIMSEIFNDTSTAFYVILLVWMADQYDAICCHSPIGKRYWLRFFYLYHFAFYAYQYRYNGQYGGFALLTSTLFILHSMIFFFHHYEMPLILYQERISRIVHDLQHNTINTPETLNVNITVRRRFSSSALTSEPTAPTQSGSSGEATATTAHRPNHRCERTFISSRSFTNVRTALGGRNRHGQRMAAEQAPVDPALSSAGERTADEIIRNTMDELFGPLSSSERSSSAESVGFESVPSPSDVGSPELS
ncbi:membralin isoform 1 [Aphelenchoides avenae]|nr:membralin isoform 1 [Aphelenchus avenae]